MLSFPFWKSYRNLSTAMATLTYILEGCLLPDIVKYWVAQRMRDQRNHLESDIKTFSSENVKEIPVK